MGTDSVKLFNKALADQILRMDHAHFIHFLEENIDALKRKPFTLSVIVFAMEENGDSGSEAVGRLISGEQTFTQMNADVAQDFGFGDEEIDLDYWGSYSAVFAGHPEGSISSLDYLPDQEEEIFLLLCPEHVDQMIHSLHEHAHDLHVMEARDIKKLEAWRDICATDPSYMVAYLFDY